jgi:iron complex outermembrane receptor protein
LLSPSTGKELALAERYYIVRFLNSDKTGSIMGRAVGRAMDRRGWRGGAAALALMALAAPAAAQQGGADDLQIEEIVVTAQKRQENLQAVPIAVSAFRADTLETLGATKAADIGRLVPNLSAVPTPSSTSTVSYSLRGIGQIEPLLTVDPGVGVYLDGVYVARQTGGSFQLADIERVEVLRGPQGTLYGRNTTGGAVSVVTKAPSGKFDLRQTLGYGNYDQWKSLTTVDLPAMGALALKVSYLHAANDGYVKQRRVAGVSYAVNSFGDDRTDAVALAAQLTPSDSLKIDYRFDFSDETGVPLAQQLVYAAPAFQGILTASQLSGGTGDVSPNRLGSLSADTQGLDHNRSFGHALTGSWEMTDSLTLKSITAYRQWDNRLSGSDLDGNTLRLGVPPRFFTTFWGINDRHQRQVSEELQLLGEYTWGHFIGGLYYFRETGSEFNQQNIPDPGNGAGGPAIPGSPAAGAIVDVPLDYSFRNKSAGAFGQATVHVVDRFDVTAGGRFTKDWRSIERRLYGNLNVLPNALATLDRGASFTKFNWTVTGDYSFTDDIHGYFRAATAYKTGGFNPRASTPANYGFGPENLMAYEAGVKSELFGRRLRLNLAAFQNDYDDLQVQQFEGIGGATSRTVNAGKARIRGIEADMTARLTTELTLSGGIGLLDPKYKSFLFRDPVTGLIGDVAGTAKFPNTAKVTANVALDYTRPLVGDTAVALHLDASYRSKLYYIPVSRLNQVSASPGMWLANGRLAVTDIPAAGGRLELALWAKNILNKDYRLWSVEFANSYAISTFGIPRTYGLEATFRY